MYPTFLALNFFIFPHMIRYNLFILFFDVAKMVIIHMKFPTFGYKQNM